MKQVCFNYRMHNFCFNVITVISCVFLFCVGVFFVLFPFEMIGAVNEFYDPYDFLACNAAGFFCLPFEGIVNFRIVGLAFCLMVAYTLSTQLKCIHYYRLKDKPGLIISDEGICVNASCETEARYPRSQIKFCRVFGFNDHIGLNIYLQNEQQECTIHCELDRFQVDRPALKDALNQYGYLA